MSKDATVSFGDRQDAASTNPNSGNHQINSKEHNSNYGLETAMANEQTNQENP